MPINNVQKYLIQPSKMRKFVTHMNKAGVLLPVVLLESTVTGGRTYQAYKRGGYTEARERLCEESVGAVFWLGGVKAFNSLGNKIGQKFFGVANPDFSLSKDAVRQPFENMLRDKNAEKARKFLIGFKFAKIAFAVVAAASILGFVVPKVNQKITRAVLKGKKQESKDKVEVQNAEKPLVKTKAMGVSMESFLNKTSAKKPSFGKLSLSSLAAITDKLENDDIWKLLSTDVGVLTGRTYNARNKDERIEILFRDAASIYFYLRCKDDVMKFLSKRDGFGGKLSSLNPVAAMNTHNLLVKEIIKKATNEKLSMNMDDVNKLLLGSNSKFVEENLAKINFAKGDVVALQDVEKVLQGNENLIKKAREMATLQPERNLSDLGHDIVGKLLTKQQVKDVLSDSVVSSPKLIKQVVKDAFNGEATDAYKFISNQKIEALRSNIDDYVNVVLEYARKNNLNEITPETLLKINKMNIVRNAINVGAGLGVAALFLSTIIPKVQYFITKIRTGSSEFPGVKEDK